MSNDQQQSAVPATAENVVAFIKAKIADVERGLICRQGMQATWCGGTDESWRKVGCSDSRAVRLEHSAAQGRIAHRLALELQMYHAVLKRIGQELAGSEPDVAARFAQIIVEGEFIGSRQSKAAVERLVRRMFKEFACSCRKCGERLPELCGLCADAS